MTGRGCNLQVMLAEHVPTTPRRSSKDASNKPWHFEHSQSVFASGLARRLRKRDRGKHTADRREQRRGKMQDAPESNKVGRVGVVLYVAKDPV